MDDGERLAAAAQALVGVPFQLYGRDPAVGLDCVGLVAASLRAIGRQPLVPANYRLRNSTIAPLLGTARRSSLFEMSGAIEPGDVLLIAPGPAQHHLMICVQEESVVHAHYGLRRVVRQPFSGQPRLLKHWRLIEPNKEL